jgi:L-aspartate oxidase
LLAYEAGAAVADLELVQFHPTALAGNGLLLSEALRGDGALLVDREGRRFVDELAPRDVVARAVAEQGSALLDLRPVDRTRYPALMARIAGQGFDPASAPVPVEPAAHYTMGGIATDHDGATELPGLYAAGECACTGVHGANRLASTSLLEGLVWGTRAARDIAAVFDDARPYRASEIHRWYHPKKDEIVDPALVNQDWLTIRSTMWNYAGIIRTRKRLERAKSDLEYLSHRIEKFYQAARIGPAIVGLRHGILVALMITRAALANPVSRGAHFIKK